MIYKTCSFDLATALHDVRPLLCGDLGSAENFDAGLEIARILPSFGHAGFECPLGTDTPGMDFGTCLRRIDEGGQLTPAPGTDSFTALQAADPVWRHLAAFAAEWRRDDSTLATSTPTVWLEFDLGRDASRTLPTPSLFVKFMGDGNRHADALARSNAFRALIEKTVEILGLKPKESTIRNLVVCHREFQDISESCEIGFWLSRRTSDIRLVFTKIQAPAAVVEERLRRMGWPGDMSLRTPPWSFLWPAEGSVSVALDVGADIAPGIALELYPLPPNKPIPFGEIAESWAEMTTKLIDLELCSSAKRRAILNWLGGTLYAPACAQDAEIPVDDTRYLVRRGINHIKISSRTGHELKAKAYLSITALTMHQPMPFSPFSIPSPRI